MKRYLSMIGNIALYLLILIAAMFSVTYFTRYIYTRLEGAAKEWLFSNQNIMMVIISILAILIYTAVFRIRKQSLIQYCRFKAIDGKAVYMLIFIALAMGVFSTAFIKLSPIAQNVAALAETVDTFMGSESILIALLSSVIIVPAFEEIVFRGLVYNEMRKVIPFGVAVVLQSLLYAVFQLNIPAAIFGFVGGILYVLAYEWLDSMWAPILLQTVSCLFMLVFKQFIAMDWLFGAGDVVLSITIITSLAAIVFTSIKIKGKYHKAQQIGTHNQTISN